MRHSPAAVGGFCGGLGCRPVADWDGLRFGMGCSWNLTVAGVREDFLGPGGASSDEIDLAVMRVLEAAREGGGATEDTEVVRERVTGGRSFGRKFEARSVSRNGGMGIGTATEGAPADTKGFTLDTVERVSVSDKDPASPRAWCRSLISCRSRSFSSSLSATERPPICPLNGFVCVVDADEDEFLLRTVAESDRYPELSRWR